MPKKKVDYSPAKMVKRLSKALSVRQAIVPEIVKEEDLRRKAIRLHLRGRDHDYIADKLQASTEQVHGWIKEKLKLYIQESFDPDEVKAVLAKRYDNIMYQALYMAMPHPMTNEFGYPVIGNVCRCELDEGQLCGIEGHTAQKISNPDPTWARIYLEILSEQKKMYGVDAADKMKQKLVDKLEREYRGVAPAVIEKL